ncbi:hypothetical protein ACFCW6_01885 [Streptomyces sp. NPDC056333]|uniref:hypothetical protein n=1 Tax=Streptomyces sp. NPDC056333 TaxID=3345786 RepID=UPI0035DF679F
MTMGAAQVRAARSGVRIGGTGVGPAACSADRSKWLPEVEPKLLAEYARGPVREPYTDSDRRLHTGQSPAASGLSVTAWLTALF